MDTENAKNGNNFEMPNPNKLSETEKEREGDRTEQRKNKLGGVVGQTWAEKGPLSSNRSKIEQNNRTSSFTLKYS